MSDQESEEAIIMNLPITNTIELSICHKLPQYWKGLGNIFFTRGAYVRVPAHCIAVVFLSS